MRHRTTRLWVAALLVGGLAGLAAVAMSRIAHGLQRLWFGLGPEQRLSAVGQVTPLRLLALPLGGLLLGLSVRWLRQRRAPVDVIEANSRHGGRIAPRDSLIVVGQTLLSNGCGASVGLEAGYAQAGGGLASVLGQALKLRRRDLRTLVGAGAGAAIGAAFGAPLTGSFYAFEIVLGGYRPATFVPVALAALAAAATARSLHATGYLLLVGYSHLALTGYPLYLLLGLICALLAIGFMRLVTLLEHRVHHSPLPTPFAPLLGGLLLMPLGWLSPMALSGGHGALGLVLLSQYGVTALLLALLLKLTASTLSLSFGFRGGLFFASLLLGALVGRLFQLGLTLFPALPPLTVGDAALVGLAAFATAVMGAPITMVLLVLEITRNLALTGAAIGAVLVSNLLVRTCFGYSFATWRLHLRGEGEKDQV